MALNYCMGCMRKYEQTEAVCPVCGFVHGNRDQSPHYLKMGTILNGKFLVGRALGQGGFGITYVGVDLVLDRKVAIKEYFPVSTGYAMRSSDIGPELTWIGDADSNIKTGFDSFLKEARNMSRLQDIPNVVDVRECFAENNTAYIVMSYIEGQTLSSYIHQHGPMSFSQAVRMLEPIMLSMKRVNDVGVIHRDISPDNLMVTPDGQVWLLDLGASKSVSLGSTQSVRTALTQKVVKSGFSPFEQYLEQGNVGSWTDVYAMAATLYYCVAGTTPPSAPERMSSELLPDSERLTQQQRNVLLHAMAMMPEKRTVDMQTLLTQLKAAAQPKKTNGDDGRSKKNGNQTPAVLIGAAAALLVLLCGLMFGLRQKKEPEVKVPPQTAAASAETVWTSAPVTEQTEAAIKAPGETEAEFSFGEPVETAAPGWQEAVPAATADSGYMDVQTSSAHTLAAGQYHSLAIRDDGTVLAVGYTKNNRCGVSGWNNIISVAAYSHSVGLRKDGTVVAVGENRHGECNVSEWSDIIAIAAGDDLTVGLQSDGRVVAVGRNDKHQCEVSGWRDIVAIAAGARTVYGLKSDGTVVAAGSNASGQSDVQNWKNIKMIAAGNEHVIGLKADGTVVTAGNNSFHQLELDVHAGVADICCGNQYTVILYTDGTVYAIGQKDNKQLNVAEWTNVAEIAAGATHTLARTKDGRILSCGSDGYGQRGLS